MRLNWSKTLYLYYGSRVGVACDERLRHASDLKWDRNAMLDVSNGANLDRTETGQNDRLGRHDVYFARSGTTSRPTCLSNSYEARPHLSILHSPS